MSDPINVWNEVRVTGDGISISLISEGAGNPPVVEDEAWFTFDELQEMGPSEPINLNLSDESRSAMVGGRQSDDEPTPPQRGDPMVDDNAPSWAEDSRVVVEQYLPSVCAYEYVIEGPNASGAMDPTLQARSDETVAAANPSYSADEPVVLARYVDSPAETYAFPESRLVEPSREHFPYPLLLGQSLDVNRT